MFSALLGFALFFTSTGAAFGKELIIFPSSVRPLTRAEFVAYIVTQTHEQASMDTCLERLSASDYTLLFTDVARDSLYAKEICVALREGIIRGFRDGSFRPNTLITFAEASKVLVMSYAVFPAAWYPNAEPWYAGFVRTLEYRGAIPTSIGGMLAPVTVEQAEDMSRRLQLQIASEPSIGYGELMKREQQRKLQTH